jgi:hypothetical protein
MATGDTMTGRDALLRAFDRLFDKAAKKLSVECSDAEKAEAKQRFEERFAMLLEALKSLELPIFRRGRRRHGGAIEKLARRRRRLPRRCPVPQAQEMMRLAHRAAEQASTPSAPPATYGGNQIVGTEPCESAIPAPPRELGTRTVAASAGLGAGARTPRGERRSCSVRTTRGCADRERTRPTHPPAARISR